MTVASDNFRRSVWLRFSALVLSLFTLLVAAPARASDDKYVVPDIRGETSQSARSEYRMLRIPLTIHIATGEGRAAFDVRRLDRAVESANEAMRPYGLSVYVARIFLMPDGYAKVRHRRDRRKLAGFAAPDGSVHVFLVNSLELGGPLRADRSVRGLHWKYRGLVGRMRNREYLVVSNDAPPTTLVHEIGHLFGLEHDTSQQNLMCSCRQGPRQIFTLHQGWKMRAGALAYFSRQP